MMDAQPDATTTMPSYGNDQEAPSMGISEAMDVLDEFHIKRSDYDRVMQALETVYGDQDEPEATPDADNGNGLQAASPDSDQAMADSLFDTKRNRKDYA